MSMLMQPRYKLTDAEASSYPAEIAFRSAVDELDLAVARARDALLAHQHAKGYWCYELEADCTIPAEYILMTHFMDEVDEGLESKIANYLRARQADHGGWPLYLDADFDLSCSVKAYYALKLAGDDPNAPHMEKARQAILDHGGAAHSNVFTRIALALFGQIPWRGVPFVPVEHMLLPRWAPFHISKISYWSRTVMVPLSILCSLKPRAANPKGVDIPELFTTPPFEERHYFRANSALGSVFLILDRVPRALEPLIPSWIRQRAIKRAETWVTARLNGTGGLGGIFPAIVNAYEVLALLGYPEDHPYRVETKQAIRNLLVIGDTSAYCQPCVSPIWDTALAAYAVAETSPGDPPEELTQALDWLAEHQLADEPGDWRENHPELEGGGWAFQFQNTYYPDLDDTPMVAWAMHRADPLRYQEAIERAADWTAGMQSANGGFGSFDSDNTCYYLNAIPFADHGALLDPPTSDITGRCLVLLSLANKPEHRAARDKALRYLREEQEPDGSWFGRWGTNYIYGTWSVLAALEIAGVSPREPYIQRAAAWLTSVQHPDGGWGEGNDTYFDPAKAGRDHASTPFQTAWALLALMAAGQVHSGAVRRGVECLKRTQGADGLWHDPCSTAPGFPRVFFLRYHGYTKYFPLWALARYRNLKQR